ncbi:hypothetical protein LY28_02533 [Ruminiclostridium sufflavum DSM 19573]|uniref:WD40 repeat protein n=1 Tax=Ruminiclostridium sufflavum DSM 19573 TaxID=1121337 RepID=A0A318XKL2_9FIRM|nr:hypothetical protein [Ruminiclostridium sufflavum]PYG86913.1 hypothetical protein LY28_02533 [Ruminiclostridium sufflavum DSM 19573]
MKTLAKWYKWILLAVIFQFCGLLYVNNVFLNTNVTVSIKDANVSKEVMTGDLKVPGAAMNVSMSYNAEFSAYLLDGVLHIINVDSNDDKGVSGSGKDKITYFRWLPDRNMVIFSSNTRDGKKGTVQISTYEPDSDTLRDYPQIDGLTAESQIMDIELSQYTNVVYAKIKTSDSKSKIIRFNVMSQYAHVMNLGAEALIKECSFVNKLVYQNEGEAVYIYDGINKTKNKVPIDSDNVRVLDIDLNDVLYVGILDSSGNITKIYHQKIGDEKLTDEWTKVDLKTAISPKNIIISGNGNIYSNDTEENKIINLANNLKASYRGDFVEVLDGALVSKDENKVIITSLKEY